VLPEPSLWRAVRPASLQQRDAALIVGAATLMVNHRRPSVVAAVPSRVAPSLRGERGLGRLLPR